ncbi:MAG TPA: HEAT repeat domain-containing protein [Candidatus Angelobacter sp.]
MSNLENLLRIVIWVALSVLAVDLVLVLFILRRRLSRWLYFNKKDMAVKRFTDPVRDFLAGNVPIEDLVSVLRSGRRRAARDAIRDLLLESLAGGNRKLVTDVLFRLGFVDAWATEAFGRRRARQLIHHIVTGERLPLMQKRKFKRVRRLRLFCVRRARAVAHLGCLDVDFAKIFMREALADPSPYVGRANVTAMGHNRELYEVPILLELLRQTAQGASELPVHSVKTALVRHAVTELDLFVPFLNDENPRFRFLLVDSIREICDAAPLQLEPRNFPEPLYQWFLERAAQDESIDVRARSARVIRHFHDAAAIGALRALLLDKNEFVRLHTVRACADPYYSELISDIGRRITDVRWLVREAAVKTLATFGRPGRQHLENLFLATNDQYASEQTIEEMQRAGIIVEMLPALGAQSGESEAAVAVCAKMVRMGKTNLLINLLSHETRLSRWASITPSAEPVAITAQRARAKLLEILLASPSPELMEAVRLLAGGEEGQLRMKAQSVLQSDVEKAAARRATHA